jgi:hypothetical protein
MKAGCFYICFQVAEPGEDARCCNIPKLNEEFESFRGPRRGSSNSSGSGFVLSFPRWLAVRPHSVCQGQ